MMLRVIPTLFLSLLSGVHVTSAGNLRTTSSVVGDEATRSLGHGHHYGGGYRCPTLTAELDDPAEESGVTGYVTFTCPDFDSDLTLVTYEIYGLTPGKHALHVHESPVDPDCASTGGHWNPKNNNHGSNLDAQRHIGDLGNVLADEDGVASGSLLAYVPLGGSLGISGLAVVVHEGEDDLGLGGDDGSRAVGNAGARPACGTILGDSGY
mmetsp:Transcript_15704/g.28304  ORF Transcript_15704/g.28304 Transcript_15704/m.28304 type:complete len:209 (+) Transcript_15704:61-687(+)